MSNTTNKTHHFAFVLIIILLIILMSSSLSAMRLVNLAVKFVFGGLLSQRNGFERRIEFGAVNSNLLVHYKINPVISFRLSVIGFKFVLRSKIPLRGTGFRFTGLETDKLKTD